MPRHESRDRKRLAARESRAGGYARFSYAGGPEPLIRKKIAAAMFRSARRDLEKARKA